jgi:mRNA interferase MazF
MSAPSERAIRPGDIFWVQLDSGEGEDARIPHPYVVIEADAPAEGRPDRLVVCALTSNLKRVSMPGNILLDAGEGNLPRQSVIEVSKVSTIEMAQLGEYIGTLSAERVAQIAAGRRFVQRFVTK